MIQMVRAGALAGYQGLLRRFSVDTSAPLQALGLPDDYLDRPDQLIPLETKIALLETGAKLTGCAHFGLTLARQQNISMLGTVGLLLQQSPTLRDAITTIAGSIDLHVQALTVKLEEQGGLARFHFGFDLDEPTAASRQHSDNAVLSAYNILCFLINDALPLRAVYFSGPEPESLRPYNEVLHAPIRFGNPDNCLVFDLAYLDLPVSGANPALRGLIGDFLRKSQNDGFQERLLWIIENLLPNGPVALDQVAAQMGLAPRTLQDRLRHQGVTFQRLLDQTRVERVCTYMQDENLSLTEIAEMVGYSQLSALTRSFKRVTGLSPAQWRREQAAAQSSILASPSI